MEEISQFYLCLFQGVEFNGLVPGHVFGKFDYAETEPVVRGLPRLPPGHQTAHGAHQEYWRHNTPGLPYKRDTSSQAKSQKPAYSIPSEALQSGFRFQSDSARREYKDVSAPNKNFRQTDFQKIEETFVNFFPTFDSF